MVVPALTAATTTLDVVHSSVAAAAVAVPLRALSVYRCAPNLVLVGRNKLLKVNDENLLGIKQRKTFCFGWDPPKILEYLSVPWVIYGPNVGPSLLLPGRRPNPHSRP